MNRKLLVLVLLGVLLLIGIPQQAQAIEPRLVALQIDTHSGHLYIDGQRTRYRLDYLNEKLQVPSIVLLEVDDPAEVIIQRLGRQTILGDLVFYEPVTQGTNVGLVRWGGYDGTDMRNLAAIYARAAEAPSATSSKGELWFGVTPQGQISALDMAALIEPTNGETALWLLVQSAGVKTMVPVRFGAPDSGGPGYRILRVPLP